MKLPYITSILTIALTLSSLAIEPEKEKMLIDLYEEERVAFELYQGFNAQYDLRPFANISSSEQRHRELMADLLKSFDITPPKSLGNGKFENPELQKIYDQLSAEGKVSVEKALAASALVEETDISDLEQVAKASDSKEVKDTCELLIAASENHLRAFVRNLESRDVTYTPQVIAEKQFKEIIAQEMSRGGKGKGKGRGKGAGKGCCCD